MHPWPPTEHSEAGAPPPALPPPPAGAEAQWSGWGRQPQRPQPDGGPPPSEKRIRAIIGGFLTGVAVVGIALAVALATTRHDSASPLPGSVDHSPKRSQDPALEVTQPFGIPGPKGNFTYGGISFRYPREWELVVTAGYHGLVGNNLWTIPLGKDSLNYVLIMADYFPWDYSEVQMRGVARQLADSMAKDYAGRVTHAPVPVTIEEGKVFAFEITGQAPNGRRIESQMYVFAWKHVEFYFDCQHAPSDPERIEQGCQQIFRTLRLVPLSADGG